MIGRLRLSGSGGGVIDVRASGAITIDGEVSAAGGSGGGPSRPLPRGGPGK